MRKRQIHIRTLILTVISAAVLMGPAIAKDNAPANASTAMTVEQALAWRLPYMPCETPRVTNQPQGKNEEGNPGGNLTIWDTDYYSYERYERKVNRWRKCMQAHDERLAKAFDALMGSAAHGLTQDQAKAILAKMKAIQDVRVGIAEELEARN